VTVREGIAAVISIIGSRHVITGCGDTVHVGCLRHSLAKWLADYRAIGEAHGYTPEEIEEYGAHLRRLSRVMEVLDADTP
jgi:hypothetical protein